MQTNMMSLRTLLVFTTLYVVTLAHTVITYPGWRGDNLITNGTVGVDDYQPDTFPYGMQWMYPCMCPFFTRPSIAH